MITECYIRDHPDPPGIYRQFNHIITSPCHQRTSISHKMTQTATDTRVSVSSTIAPPETIPASEINQSQAPTNYDNIKYVTPRLTIFRERMEKAHDAGDTKEENAWTAVRDRELEQLTNRDFDAAYKPFLDYVRQTEQMS
jgi:hypothetical protein